MSNQNLVAPDYGPIGFMFGDPTGAPVSAFSQADLYNAITLLSTRFDVPICMIQTTRTRRGHYHHDAPRLPDGTVPKLGTVAARDLAVVGRITMPCKSWRGAHATLVHEFAHHLTHCTWIDACHRLGPDRRWRDYRFIVPKPHGKLFHRMLTRVANAWYGDARLYPWITEYKRIAAAGPARV